RAFLFIDPAPIHIHTLSLHDALLISSSRSCRVDELLRQRRRRERARAREPLRLRHDLPRVPLDRLVLDAEADDRVEPPPLVGTERVAVELRVAFVVTAQAVCEALEEE